MSTPLPEFRHPEADAETLLGGVRVAYRLRRSQRRSIGLQVSPEGLTVSVPQRAGVQDVEHALRTKAAWILSKLTQQRERAHRQHAAQPQWAEGTVLPCLGGTLTLRLQPGQRGAHGPALTEVAEHISRLISDTTAVAFPGSRPDSPARAPALELWLGVPRSGGAPPAPLALRDQAAAWLQHQALALFEQRLRLYAPRLGVSPCGLGLTNARTRWGSASANGTIRLNWRLLHFPLPVLDYVVVHELAHLRHMNHGPDFWALVGRFVPDVAACRYALRQPELPSWH